MGATNAQLARLVAERFNTEHSEAVVGREHAEGLLHRLAWHFDEPFADTSSLPSYVVSKIARELVTVVLTGDGGDEVLGGYPVHQSEKLASMWQQLPKPIRGAASTVSEAVLAVAIAAGVRRARRARSLLDGAKEDFVSRLERKQIGFSAAQRRALIGGNTRVRPAREFITKRWRVASARRDRAAELLAAHGGAARALPLQGRSQLHGALAGGARSFPRSAPGGAHGRRQPAVKMPGLTRKSSAARHHRSPAPRALLKAGKRGFDPPMAAWLERSRERLVGDPAAARAAGLFVSSGACGLPVRSTGEGRPPMGLWALSMLAVQLASPLSKSARAARRAGVKYLFVTADKYPPFRVDVRVLFADEFSARGHEIIG